MSATLARLRQISNAHKILVRKPGGKRPFGKLFLDGRTTKG
jgi:hypothetical protein